ncbi:alcohol dehydrogenase catalytic domain-containing protein [filamentous cyanobacterium LEGE 11480]|uniref:Alcohol dehydrogenase catalytic domain-containing protein n=1 Tax=Romeriopsis navalis LEGE 11480 TaxID=2777977 RepID=A0A928VRY9_9CYAN|nr:alcohol dehydrogenase catalytic domain-containing protein [Romeriopsis navalis]MBE9031094.1 alcohol dehydrogenase catalytic domain-containing protein [Romeriopsis navalis LEGE 11480]
MLAAVLYGQEDLRLENVPAPEPGPGEIVIQVKAATTCGTDLKVWRRGGHARMLKPPTLFGHEAAGIISALGSGVTQWQVGDRVVPNNSAPCGQCFFCDRQAYSLCKDLIFNNGTFAQYLKIPAPIVNQNLLPIPDNLSYGMASMTEPLACVLHGIARSNAQPGDRIVLLGDGAIGLMFVAALAAGDHVGKPSEIIVFGGSPQRLQVAEQLGATQTYLHRAVENIPGLVKSLTDGWGADIVIEATGKPQAWELAIACGRPGSTVNLFGGCPGGTTISVNTEQLHYNELTLKGVFHNTPEFVRSALDFIAQGTAPLELLLSDQQPLQNLGQVFNDMRDRQVIKVAMRPD